MTCILRRGFDNYRPKTNLPPMDRFGAAKRFEKTKPIRSLVVAPEGRKGDWGGKATRGDWEAIMWKQRG
jgi:hypothetical protein